jgi:hypothetical protein
VRRPVEFPRLEGDLILLLRSSLLSTVQGKLWFPWFVVSALNICFCLYRSVLPIRTWILTQFFEDKLGRPSPSSCLIRVGPTTYTRTFPTPWPARGASRRWHYHGKMLISNKPYLKKFVIERISAMVKKTRS